MDTLFIEKFTWISIDCLEKHTNQPIEIHIQDWIDTLDPWDNRDIRFDKSSDFVGNKYRLKDVIYIGDCDYRPIKWKCELCNLWNYELRFADVSGSTTSCKFCNESFEM